MSTFVPSLCVFNPSSPMVLLRLFRPVQPLFYASFSRTSRCTCSSACLSKPPVRDASPQTLHANPIRIPSTSIPFLSSRRILPINTVDAYLDSLLTNSQFCMYCINFQGLRYQTVLMCTVSTVSCCGPVLSIQSHLAPSSDSASQLSLSSHNPPAQHDLNPRQGCRYRAMVTRFPSALT